MILPKSDYCDFVWNNVAPSRYTCLERLQTRAVRIALKDSNLSPLNSTMHNLTFVFKCLHNMFIPLGVMV